ncbi:PAAR-like domain-containing protein [Xanthomonas maliensis]|uniref:PAAR-like domain-containing protein n=1 Tax=Xanthomonas maliensis TaxID=1321368 RepID=UPI002351CADC|nr:PAAR-like domain-containing protein [Xanthomonas maliensis]
MVSICPDVCKTPMGSSIPAVPYPLVAKLDTASQPAGTVRANAHPIVLFDASYTPATTGDEAGTAKGVQSGTVAAKAWPKQRSSTVRVEGKRVIRHDDQFWMNGNYSAPSSKAQRWKERQEAIARAREKAREMPPGKKRDALLRSADRLEKNNFAVERARLSQSAYSNDGSAPEGWRNVSNDSGQLSKYGLKPSDLSPEGSNFRAQLYAPDPAVFGDSMQPTLAFKGTDMLSGADWSNNIAQGLGHPSEYYQRAVGIGTAAGRAGSPLHFAGHSLGGGLASAASQASGFPATTFNAAGLNSGTVAQYGGTAAASDIDAFRVAGEVLTRFQEGGVLENGPLGALISHMAPDAAGVPHELMQAPGNGDMFRKHMIGPTIDAIEQEKKLDLAKMDALSAPRQPFDINSIPTPSTTPGPGGHLEGYGTD